VHWEPPCVLRNTSLLPIPSFFKPFSHYSVYLPEDVFPFKKHNLLSGGDPKLGKTENIHKKSKTRYERQMPPHQQRVFMRFLRREMRQLGYI